MKTLLITNYWKPWNASGTMRWLQMGRYIDFDVLTTRKPRKGFYDETLPKSRAEKVIRKFTKWPAVLWGIGIILYGLRLDYDVYIVTTPPYTLSFLAWLLQTMGCKVVLDIRDNQDNKNNHWKLTAKLCDYFRGKIKHRTTSFQFLDEGATRILSGYNPELKKISKSWEFIRSDRMTYDMYCLGLSCGHIPDYQTRMEPRYATSSFVNLKYLGFKNLLLDNLHNECINQPVQSWETSAKQMKDYIEGVR